MPIKQRIKTLAKENNMSVYDFNRVALDHENITNAFTQEHLNTHNSLCPEASYPELLNLPVQAQAIQHTHRRLLDRRIIKDGSAVDPRSQKGRAGMAILDEDMDRLQESFHKHGAKLKNLAPCVFENDLGEFVYMTGSSRDEIYDRYNFTDIIVNVFTGVDGTTDMEQQSALSFMATWLNPAVDAHVCATTHDIRLDINRALDNGWTAKTFDAILERILPQTERVNISVSKASMLAAELFEASKKGTGAHEVKPMVSRDAKKWAEKCNYIDVKDKVKYFFRSHDREKQGTIDAIKYAHKHPKEEVRIVVFCGILTSGDPQQQWKNRSGKFHTSFYDIINTFQNVVFDGADIKIKNLKLYGVIPQLGEFQSVNKICLYKDDGTTGTYQK